MITDVYDIQLDGVNYRLDRDSPQPYIRQKMPLRVLNSQIVQGQDRTNFNLREDLMEWRMTDWTGGPNKRTYEQGQDNRFWQSANIDWTQPGQLRPSLRPYQINLPANFRTRVRGMIEAHGTAYLVGTNAVMVYRHTGGLPGWAPVDGDAPPSGETWVAWAGNETWLFLSTDKGKVYGYKFQDINRTGTYTLGTRILKATLPEYQTNNRKVGTNLAVLENNLYILSSRAQGNERQFSLYEVPVTAEPEPGEADEELDDTADGGLVGDFDHLARGGADDGDNSPYRNTVGDMIATDNRLYIIQNTSRDCRIWEWVPEMISRNDDVPDTPGTLAVSTVLTGATGLSLTYNLGVLYVACNLASTGHEQHLVSIYQDTISVIGRLGYISQYETRQNFKPTVGAATISKVFFVVEKSVGPDLDFEDNGPGLWVYDTVSGGLGQLTQVTTVDLRDDIDTVGEKLLLHNQYIMGLTSQGAWAMPLLQLEPEDIPAVPSNPFTALHQPQIRGELLSSWHDFGTSGEKMVLDIVTEGELEENETVELGAVSRGESQRSRKFGKTETTEVDPTTGTEHEIAVRLKIGNWDKAETKIDAVSVSATVIRGYFQWRLTIDCSNEQGAARGWSGSQLMKKLELLERKRTVVEFKDGFRDSGTGNPSTHRVVVDGSTSILDKAGEGRVEMFLREIEET